MIEPASAENITTDSLAPSDGGQDGAPGDSSRAPLLELTGLKFSYGAGSAFQLTVDHFAVEAGQTVLLLGESGTGKSTLLNLITGVARQQAGEIKIVGQKMRADKPAQADRLRGQHIGLIYQSLNLLPYTSVKQAVVMALAFSSLRRKRIRGPVDQEVKRLLNLLNLDATALFDRPVVALSAGQQQRVAAARALIGRPELIVADEPTSALDSKNQARFLDLVLGSLDRSSQSLLMVSHDERIAPLFDRVVRIEELTA